jgi:hypothetical protein
MAGLRKCFGFGFWVTPSPSVVDPANVYRFIIQLQIGTRLFYWGVPYNKFHFGFVQWQDLGL